jgi:hypothetical protein
MLILKKEFADQKSKINIYFEHLKEYDSEKDLRGNKIVINTTQKASAVLVLYNLIESMTSKLLKLIHDKVMNDNFSYFEFNDSIRKTVFVYYKKILDENDTEKYHSRIEDFYFLINNKNKINLRYDELTDIYQLFSGNLDAREIRNIFKNKYGFKLNENELNAPVLKRIREGRNKLAHGNISFEEYGRDLSIPDLLSMKDKVFKFIDALIVKVELYLSGKIYKKTEYRKSI